MLKKCRAHDGDVIFIDASLEFEKNGNQNKLTDAHVSKIVDSYNRRVPLEKYAYVATLDEIADNDFNLNIPRYVDIFGEPEPIDLNVVATSLVVLQAKLDEADKVIDQGSKQLGLPRPYGSNASLLGHFKAECLRRLFSRENRFVDDEGNAFPDWEEKRFGDIFSWVRTNSLSRENLTFDPGDIQNIHYGDIHTKFHSSFRQDWRMCLL